MKKLNIVLTGICSFFCLSLFSSASFAEEGFNFLNPNGVKAECIHLKNGFIRITMRNEEIVAEYDTQEASESDDYKKCEETASEIQAKIAEAKLKILFLRVSSQANCISRPIFSSELVSVSSEQSVPNRIQEPHYVFVRRLKAEIKRLKDIQDRIERQMESNSKTDYGQTGAFSHADATTIETTKTLMKHMEQQKP